MMDDLTEQIASEIGPKWVQLLSKLQLGYRDRYRLCVQYKDEPKPVQEAKCTRDTIRSLTLAVLLRWLHQNCVVIILCFMELTL